MQFTIINQNYTLSIIILKEILLESIEEVIFLAIVMDTNLNFQSYT